MARHPEKHPDPIVNDLQTIRRLDWSDPEGFRVLKTLLSHPIVTHFAFQPKKDRQRIRALEMVLKEVVDRVGQAEGESPPLGRSLAVAGTALLRLAPEFRQMSLEDIRSHIAGAWGKKGGGSISLNGFRLHLEPPIYEELAAEFRRLAREQPEDYSKISTDDGIDVDYEELEIEDEVAAKSDLRSIADYLRQMETKLHRNRLSHIAEGVLRIRSEEEMLGVLIALTGAAKREFLAVDYVDVGEWFSSMRLNRYLTVQLKRVKEDGIKLVRIRIVRDEELQYESRSREQLEKLIELHADAGDGALLLCRENAIKDLGLSFAPHVGLFLVDPAATPAAVTGKLAGDGSIGLARVYVGETAEVRQFKEEHERLRATAVEQDRELREELARSR